MWIPGLKLSREGMVNSPPCAKVKKETARHDLTDASRGSLASSLLKSISMSDMVKGSLLGRFEEGGAKFIAPSSAAFTWTSFIDQGWP